MMKPVGVIGTAALFLLLGATAPVWAQGNQSDEQAKADQQAKDESGQGNIGCRA